MAKKTNTAPVETPAAFDMSHALAALPLAAKADAKWQTEREKARKAALELCDTLIATFGKLDVLLATQRKKDASPELKAAHVTLKENYLETIWGAAFMAKVNNSDIPVTRNIGAPLGGMKGQTKAYWQAQKGDKWSAFVGRVLAFHAEEQKAQTEPEAATKAPNRKAALDERCEANVSTAIKAMRAAAEGKKDKAETVPPHVNAAAFLALSEAAIMALSKDKAKQGRAQAALEALRALKLA